MMQIGSTVPVLNLQNQFHSRRTSLKSQMSPLNPKSLSRTRSSTRVHLANLEKLLAKPPLPEKTLRRNVSKKNFLDGLNLSRLWPSATNEDQMSPRHLGRLQQLLSSTAEEESSPRNVLGRRWREYHGSGDWSGLLDPLDENLRREVVRYGEFVQAAYRCFHSNPATPPDGPPSPRHVALPDRSYRVTKSLYATSSVGLPRWVDEAAPDLGWMTQRSSWVGYVAVCDDPREIQRMGRRDVVIALRGTATCLEWAENMRANLVDFGWPIGDNGPAKVEAGFLSLYQTPGCHVDSLAQSVVQEVRRLMEMYRGEELSITVTGHSLGAALAVLVADELGTLCKTGGDDVAVPHVAVFSFGGPRVGNQGLADRVESKKVKVLRIVNSRDVITRVPATSLAYTDVGTELRVDTKMSPYLKPNADMACCHDLEAYLHLVDGFLASNCPFRSNAKRSLARLLQDQGSNVKKLYTSKAKSLSLNLDREHHRNENNDNQFGFLSLQNCLPSPSS